MATIVSPADARPDASPMRDGLVAAAATVVMLAFHLARGVPSLHDGGGDTDSLLRLVQVRDLLAGQAWFDPTQYRMGLDGGFTMHWSRLVDLPLALLTAAIGETATLVVWPSLLFALCLWLILRAARLLAGPAAGSAVLPAAVVGGMALHQIDLFSPGSLDHHNVQLALALATLLALLHGRRAGRWGAVAGACAALMLAVGMEAAPYVAVACAIAAASLLTLDEADRRLARDFGLAFAAVSVAALAATVSPAGWLRSYCDAFSFPQASLALVGGLGLALAATMATATRAGRLASLAAIAIGAAGLALLAFPQCLSDPFADLDPRLKRYWLDSISEAQSVLDILRRDPVPFAGYYMTPLVALAVLSWAAIRGRFDRERAIVGLFLVAALLVSFWQVRGAMFSLPFASIVLAAWIGTLRSRADGGGAAAQLAMAAAWLASFGIVWQFAAMPLSDGERQARQAAAAGGASCYRHADYTALAALPHGTVVAVSNMGPSILRQTGHRALSGPYHRNVEGNLAALDLLMGHPVAGEAAARRLGIDYLLVCRGNGETRALTEWAPEGLLATLVEGSLPDWVEPMATDPSAPMQIYLIR